MSVVPSPILGSSYEPFLLEHNMGVARCTGCSSISLSVWLELDEEPYKAHQQIFYLLHSKLYLLHLKALYEALNSS